MHTYIHPLRTYTDLLLSVGASAGMISDVGAGTDTGSMMNEEFKIMMQGCQPLKQTLVFDYITGFLLSFLSFFLYAKYTAYKSKKKSESSSSGNDSGHAHDRTQQHVHAQTRDVCVGYTWGSTMVFIGGLTHMAIFCHRVSQAPAGAAVTKDGISAFIEVYTGKYGWYITEAVYAVVALCVNVVVSKLYARYQRIERLKAYDTEFNKDLIDDRELFRQVSVTCVKCVCGVCDNCVCLHAYMRVFQCAWYLA